MIFIYLHKRTEMMANGAKKVLMAAAYRNAQRLVVEGGPKVVAATKRHGSTGTTLAQINLK